MHDSKKVMRILHLLSSNQFSGAENVVCQIISMFSSEDAYEFAYSSPKGPIEKSLKEREVNYLPLDNLSKKEVVRVIRKFKPDVVHAHDMRACYIASLCCGRIKLICHIHNNSFSNRCLSVKSIGFLLPALIAKRIIYVSPSSYKGYFFSSLFKKKSEVLRNILDIRDVRERCEQDIQLYDYDVVYLGRLSYPKNPQRLIKVIEAVQKNKKDVKVALIGDGELMTETKNLVNQLGLNNIIDFLGFQRNPLKMLSCAKLMVMTSRWEGTPMCALEAMALGVPIVSTPTDGLKDLVSDGKTGFLSENDNELANKIVEIISDDRLYNMLHANTLESSERMNDTINYMKRLKTIYNERR